MELLRSHFGVGPAKAGAFLGRVHHFQRLGFPEGINTGRGKPAEYSTQAVLELAVAVHLNLAGFQPEKAVEIVKANRGAIIGSAERSEPCSIFLTGDFQTASPVEIRISVHKISEALKG